MTRLLRIARCLFLCQRHFVLVRDAIWCQRHWVRVSTTVRP